MKMSFKFSYVKGNGQTDQITNDHATPNIATPNIPLYLEHDFQKWVLVCFGYVYKDATVKIEVNGDTFSAVSSNGKVFYYIEEDYKLCGFVWL